MRIAVLVALGLLLACPVACPAPLATVSNPAWSGGGQIAFTPDGALLFINEEKRGAIDVLSVARWSRVGTLESPNFEPRAFACNGTSGRIVAFGLAAGGETQWATDLRAWDLPTNDRAYAFGEVGDAISAVACGQRDIVACGTFDGAVWLVDPAGTRPASRLAWENSVVDCICFSPDDTLLAVVYRNERHSSNYAKVYRVSDGTAVGTVVSGAETGERLDDVQFTMGGEAIVVCSTSNVGVAVSVWSLADWRRAGTAEGPVREAHAIRYSAALSVGGPFFAVAERFWRGDAVRDAALVWRMNGPTVVDEAVIELGETEGVSLALSPNGQYLVLRVGETLCVYATETLFSAGGG